MTGRDMRREREDKNGMEEKKGNVMREMVCVCVYYGKQ